MDVPLGASNDVNALLNKRVSRGRVAEQLKAQIVKSQGRASGEVLAQRRDFELRSFADLFVAYDFVPKILEHIGGIVNLGKVDQPFGLSKAFTDLNFAKNEISFPHFYPGVRQESKLFNVRSSSPSNVFTFSRSDKNLYDEVRSFLKSQELPEEPVVSDLEKIFTKAGWKIRDPKELWRWELFANQDALIPYGIFINKEDNSFSFHDVGIYKHWESAKLNILLGNKIETVTLPYFISARRAREILRISSEVHSANHRIGSTVQLELFLKSLGLTMKDATSEQIARYERRMEFLAKPQAD